MSTKGILRWGNDAYRSGTNSLLLTIIAVELAVLILVEILWRPA